MIAPPHLITPIPISKKKKREENEEWVTKVSINDVTIDCRDIIEENLTQK